MATKKAMVLAAAALLVLGAGAWLFVGSGGTTFSPTETAAAPTTETARSPRTIRAQPDATSPASVAPPVAAERKLDRPVVAVVDAATKKALPDAVVIAVRTDGTIERGTVGPDGVELGAALVGAKATLWASAPGHARRRLVDVALAAEVLAVPLDPALPVRLRFVTEAGRPLDAVEVRSRFGGAFAADAFELVADEAIAGGDVPHMLRLLFGPAAAWHVPVAIEGDGSSMRLADGVATGRWRLFVKRPGATPWLSDPFVAEGADAPSVDVPLLETPRTRRVRVVADDTKTPLADATLVPWFEYGDDQAFLPGAEIRADALGIVALPYDPVDGPRRRRPPTWWVRAPGRMGMVTAWGFDDPRKTEPIDAPIARSVGVEGEAYLPSGKPAVGGRVVVTRKGKTWGADVDAAGRFRIEEVPTFDGAVELILLVDESFAQARAEVDKDGVAHAVIGPKPSPGAHGSIVGVVTAGARPIAGAFVVDQPTNAKGAFVRTGADGRFVLEGLDVGVEHDLVVYASDPQANDDFRVRTAKPLRVEATKPLEFAFDLPSGAVRVKVLDAETKRPLAAACVSGRPADKSVERARFEGFDFGAGWAQFTAEDGVVLLRGLPPGAAHVVHVAADGYADAERTDVVPGTQDAPAELELRLTKRK